MWLASKEVAASAGCVVVVFVVVATAVTALLFIAVLLGMSLGVGGVVCSIAQIEHQAASKGRDLFDVCGA